ncbi:MAG: hypothetical protein AAGA54_14675 [Myxococcota bacterium]
MKIRSWTLLCALTLLAVPACDDEPFVDPVWGEWEGRANGCPARTEFEVDDDYRGDGRLVFDDCSVCEVNLDIEPEDDGEYEFEVAGVTCQGALDFECEIDDDELECQDAVGNRFDFERNG